MLDKRLELTLFAENPAIVTPIGIAIDSLNRIFVLESHTHLPPKEYKGPDTDVVKLFTDRDNDGKPEQSSVFARGFKEGLNMAFSPQGHLYLVTSREVWVLYDQNGDGVSEKQEKVVELVKPDKVYAHAALLGITFSPDGWMYISRGNTGSAAWRMRGTDSSFVSGYGDGGNIVRARPDGSHLQEVATGFWNPVDLKFDQYGHLLTVDNDPDSRGPNRLVHVVPGGDYGYQSLYGGSGIHPYVAWNGELPGTLPYAAGLGEAPSGLLDAATAALPSDYKGSMLATIWEESSIVRINLKPKGISVTGTTEVIIEGGQQFRPVAFATDRNGTIYFTDWMLRDYPNHGKGRIWKLSVRKQAEALEPRQLYTPFSATPAGKPLDEIHKATLKEDFNYLKESLKSADPFLQQAAVMALSDQAFRKQIIEATSDKNPQVRLGALLALQHLGDKRAEPILRQRLSDPDIRVRQLALKWAGKEGIAALYTAIDKAVSTYPVSDALFETYLETVSHLSPSFINAYSNQSETYSKSIKRTLPNQFIEAFIGDKSRPAQLRALAIRHLEQPQKNLALLMSLLAKENHPQLRLEAIRSLAGIPDEKAAGFLLKIVTDPSEPSLLQAESLLALTRQPLDASESILPLLKDAEMDVRIEAARYLRNKSATDGVIRALQQTYATLHTYPDEPLQEQIAMALSQDKTDGRMPQRPSSLAAWQTALGSGGDPARGRRVLYANQSMCSLCHAVEGRGGDLGPDLSNAGRSKTRSQLVKSILYPSEEISPEYQGWFVKLKNGEIHQGRQIDIGENTVELYLPAAGFAAFEKKDIANFGKVDKSLMPEGLENQLSVSDLRDLIAFLEAGTENLDQPASRQSSK